ncbi:MAG: phosphatidylserine decarboxylase [Alphaproteobacteria bacterium]|nr:phosphatidylserine decarboxylase [Alphaproteobacteria bacterium]
MKSKHVVPALFVLLAAAGAVYFWPLVKGPALVETAQVKNYTGHVPENMRTLIPQSQYDAIADSLMKTNKTGKTRDAGAGLDGATIFRVAASPCGPSLQYLITQYGTNAAVPLALEAVRKGLQDPPAGYLNAVGAPLKNPWHSKNAAGLRNRMVETFLDWCVFLPEASGTHDNGLQYIQDFAWFYYHNPAGRDFVQGRSPLNPAVALAVGRRFTKDFSTQRGAYMDSPASTVHVAQWVNDPRIEISDYQKQNPGDYRSWNDFFARELTVDDATGTIPSRPATMARDQFPERDYIVSAPTDCIMNPLVQVLSGDSTAQRKVIDNPLQYDTVLDVKGIPLSLAQLLEGVPQEYRDRFVGGSGQSCVLMPNTYHHFHAPVSGTIVHAAVVPSNTYGYSDFPNWAPLDGNVGRPGTDFSQFQDFQRGVIVIEVTYAGLDGKEITGYVASIPVGLDTIGSVTLNPGMVPGKVVKRVTTKLGNFYYGGSLNILLYSRGLAGNAIQTRMGNQINLFDVGSPPGN